MLNDEQILLKTVKLLENLDIFEQKTEKVLREVTEDEMRVLEDVLDDLEPANLPLNDLFSGKMRIVIDFPTMDTESELGQFVEELERQLGLKIDWNKGMVSAHREWTENSIENDEAALDFIMNPAGETRTKKLNRKFQMKIGKYFMKLDKLLSEYKEMRQIIANHVYEEPNSAAYTVSFSIGQTKEAFTTDQLKRYYQIQNGLELYAGTDQMGRLGKYYGSHKDVQAGNITRMHILAKYWQENAGYIKKEIHNLTDDKYSIIISRHPVDILRMSDFDKITSCHSPASRTNAYQSYYKCAVAEARGHGAVAYVVETEDIVKWSGRSDMSMEEIEEEMQEGEIFYDDKRQFAGTINPISRARIRHMRYYDTDFSQVMRYDDGQDVGVPEKRIYGAGIPGFGTRVVDWARTNQEEVMQNMPKEDGKIDLNRFMIFGGSYEDTANASGRASLVQALVGPNIDVEGDVKQNTDTEDDLDADLIGDIRQQYENYCAQREEYWNMRMAACTVDYDVQEDGDDGVYIRAGAKITIEWQASEWNSLPGAANPSVMYSPDTINDIYGDLLKSDGAYLQRKGELILWHCDINPEHPDLGGTTYFALSEEFEEFCQSVDVVVDDKRDAFTEILSNYFAREGFMQGGKYINLAVDIENRELSPYEWHLETDEEYEDSYESWAAYSFDYDPEEWGIDIRVLFQILDSRDYKIALRRNLLAQPQKETETEYFLAMDTVTVDSGGDAQVTVRFKITRDDPDKMVELFKELVEGDMDDEDNLTVVFNKTLATLKANLNSGVWPEQDSPATAGLNENLVKTWKQFLYSRH